MRTHMTEEATRTSTQNSPSDDLDRRRRSRAWVVPAAGTLVLFACMALVAWPMRPWGPGTTTPTLGGDPIAAPEDNLVLTDWTATPTGGAPTIGPKSLVGTQSLGIGQWIEADALSAVELAAPSIGRVTVKPGSRVRIKSVRQGQHWLELAQGEITTRSIAAPRTFNVETPGAIVTHMGADYTLTIDATGSGIVRGMDSTTAGRGASGSISARVEVQQGPRGVRVPAGYTCSIHPNMGPGTPLSGRAPSVLIDAVQRFDRSIGEPSGGAETPSSDPLGGLLAAADGADAQRDRIGTATTLWHVLRTVKGPDRAHVIERAAALVPPPSDIPGDRILNLDDEAMERWWTVIQRP